MRVALVPMLLSLTLSGCDKKSPSPPGEPAPVAAATEPAPAAGQAAAPAPAPTTVDPAAATAPAAEAAAKPDGWVLWTHPQKLISARFPGKAQQSETEAPSEIGPIKLTMAMHAEATRAFMAGGSTYDVPGGGPFDVAKALDGARDQMLASIRATVTAEKPIERDGLKGREVEFEAPGPDGATVRGVAHVYAGDTPPAGYFAAAFRMTEEPDPHFATFLSSVHLGKATESP
jgi:hypothetical protein